MKYLIFFGCLFFILIIPRFRCLLFNLPFVLVFGIRDLFISIRYKTWRVYKGGVLNAYTALFGGGKTLSVVTQIYKLYKKYHNVMVYDFNRKKWVKQVVHVISNVEFKGIPFELLTNCNQIVSCANHNKEIDLDNDTRTILLVFIDEASVMLNSRDFRSNFSPDFLNSLLTCRHYAMSMFYTTQKFNLTDKLLRDVTQHVIYCSKKWRSMVQTVYDASDLENANNPSMVKPLFTRTWFVFDKYFRLYDTLATVDNLNKAGGDMMSASEILELRGQIQSDYDSVNLSRKGRRVFKKKAAGQR